MHPSDDDRFCSFHDRAPALAVCAECGEDICGACHGVDERGWALCASCRGELRPDLTAWERQDTELSPRAFASTLYDVIRHPRSFFEDLPADGSPYRAIAFGLICLVVGLLVGRVWQFLFVDAFAEQLTSLATERAISAEVARISTFVLTPVLGLAAAGGHVALLKGSTYVVDASCSWETATRIAGYALGASTLMVVPPVWNFPVGRFLTIVWVFNLEVSALRTYFDIGPWRSMFAALLPLMGLMACGV